ncbi:MAG: leucine--tRNA ligase [Candidatus Latescibacteria bacterium]|nr:leucine--tRNA ligase [Candidatus Latescibacterota bacterium]
MEEKYDFRAIEVKWQARWEREKTFRAPDRSDRPKFYALEMFPYPSGAGLHVGHLKNYVPMDAFCRYKRMNGFNVLHPMGWDAFGQPAENEAIKRGRNPREMVPEYAASYRRTLKLIGVSYDWDREINSSLPDYYRWTQWIFLLLHRRGLAYRATAPINWCPSCKTGLANEEVKEGRCWRCDTPVEKRPMPQWFFRITAYADRLLADLDKIDWPEGLKEMQRDWIGRSKGAEVDFPVQGTEDVIRVFTTRPDTLFGATFMVLAPEHPLVEKLTAPDRRAEVDAYVRKAQGETEIDRMNAERAKTGVFIGAQAINPATEAPIPIWIADYVLMGYGTGAIMAVPAHDQRDFEFARKFDIPIRMVYQIPDGPTRPEEMREALPAGGTVIHSGPFDGLPNDPETVQKFTAWVEETGKGKGTVNYRLRDWLISRQRYWGAPIPMVHCEKCGEVPVPEDQLPVLLPEVEHYEPSGTGDSPLATIPDFVHTACPRCSGEARRETDTMGGYACSSWYFLRFVDPHNDETFAARERIDTWLPVDFYAGGAEHARSHLLYARFWTKVLHDAGLVGFEEPFLTLRNQGSVLAYTPGRRPRAGEEVASEEDEKRVLDWTVLRPEERATFPEDQIVWRWARMSKSKGNVVTPDEMAEKYGADSLRVYEMFVAPFEDDVQWTEEGINGAFRFVNRAWRWTTFGLPHFDPGWGGKLAGRDAGPETRRVRRKLHQTIRKVGEDLTHFRFNTAIAALMELTNELYAYRPVGREGAQGSADPVVLSEALEGLVLLMAPFAPHLADELWERMGKAGTTYEAAWPGFDAGVAEEGRITMVVQVNGKVRGRAEVEAGLPEEEMKRVALEIENVKRFLDGKQPRKVIVIPKNHVVSIAV